MGEILLTGIGVVSPLGVGRAAFFPAVAEGRCGIRDLTLCEPTGACEHAAEVRDYDWKSFCFSKQTFSDRCTQLAMGAARLALEDAGLKPPLVEPDNPTGLCFGSCWGCVESAEKFFAPIAQGKGKTASGLVFSHSYPNCPTSFLAIELGLRGYSTSFAGSRLSGLWALRSAFDAVRSGAAKRILVGASDAISAVVLGHLEKTGALPNTRGKAAPKTAAEATGDWARVPGEGAAFLVLEDEFSAKARGVKPIAVLEDVAESSSPLLGEEGAEGKRKKANATVFLGNTSAAAPFFDLCAALVAAKAEESIEVDAEAAGERIGVRVRAR
jgi:3-oxoacyl-[acyl-carrier-protein] synthase II